jgi:two-component system, NarL family, sensor kinase
VRGQRDASDADRLIAVLRIVAVPVLIAGPLVVEHPAPTRIAFKVVVGGFALYAVVTALLARRGLPRAGSRGPLVLVALDLAFAMALSYTSGGAFSQVRFAFLFAPLTAAFRMRFRFSLMVSIAAVLLYVVQALDHPSRSSEGDWAPFVFVQAGYLAWLGLAASLLAYLLERREQDVDRLLAARQLLVAEAIAAEERERKRLSEDLHDDAIQLLLAARHDLEDAATEDPEGPESRAYDAVTAVIRRLRQAISELHPYLLDRAGIESALTQAAERAARRGGFELDVRVERDGPAPSDQLLLRCGAELLANVARHAQATHVELELRRIGGDDVLTVSDDGCGFDEAVLDDRLREGHIGVLSLRERAEAVGGSLEIVTAPGRGTRITVRVPAEPSLVPAGLRA